MPPREERREWVVELAVSGVAVVSVDADSAEHAIALAVERVRPVDVTELADDIEATTVAGPFAPLRPRRRRGARGRETASKAPDALGQA
ncbi:MAG: hypothetical protein L0221_14225 [Chloroflexi bacterium]|nr:hypothetical protein [Chloroflexota bacterium]